MYICCLSDLPMGKDHYQNKTYYDEILLVTMSFYHVYIDLFVQNGRSRIEVDKEESNNIKKGARFDLNKLVPLIGRKRKRNGGEE